MARDLEWYQHPRKDFKPGRWMQRFGPEYTRLNTCFLCGFTSTPKKVHTRNDCYGWWWERVKRKFGRHAYPEPPYDGADSGSMLCTGCWNKVRAIQRTEDSLENAKKLVTQMERSIKDEQRNH